MFKVTISGEVDENEEYVKEILEQNEEKDLDADDPLTLAEVLLSASNTRPVSGSVERI